MVERYAAEAAPLTTERSLQEMRGYEMMTKRDWLTTGIELLGVYCVIMGCTTLTYWIPQFVAFLSTTGFGVEAEVSRHFSSMYLPYTFQPVAYFLVGFVLIRKTDWCVNKIQTKNQEDHSEQNTGNNSE